jgi:hypothetical protein
MQKQKTEGRAAQELNFLAWMAKELDIKPFRSVAWYDKSFDWLIYIGQDASYTEVSTSSPHLVLFKDNTTAKIVGMRVVEFSSLPRKLRDSLMETVGDTEIKNIEDVWIQNMLEMAPEHDAEEVEFFKELKAHGFD